MAGSRSCDLTMIYDTVLIQQIAEWKEIQLVESLDSSQSPFQMKQA